MQAHQPPPPPRSDIEEDIGDDSSPVKPAPSKGGFAAPRAQEKHAAPMARPQAKTAAPPPAAGRPRDDEELDEEIDEEEEAVDSPPKVHKNRK